MAEPLRASIATPRDQLGGLPQSLRGGTQACALKRRRKVFRRRLRLLPSCAHALKGSHCYELVEVPLRDDELVGVDDLDAQRPDHIEWEVPDVCRDDAVGMSRKCRGKHLDVIGIWQLQAAGQRLPGPFLDLPVRHRLAHLITAISELARQIGAPLSDRRDPLGLDRPGPLGRIQAGAGQAHQGIGHRHRMKRARVQQGRVARMTRHVSMSVVQPQLAGVLGHAFTGIPGTVSLTQGQGGCPLPTRLPTPADEAPVSVLGRLPTADHERSSDRPWLGAASQTSSSSN
ncbi:hypothetical protein [Accumulibacter sp.]|jgi:hypothetical protein|uniref:hypothetical protein n=1 Tax=Accumulibacter sp. TaxID=2053492 RepID=UPI003DA8EF6D